MNAQEPPQVKTAVILAAGKSTRTYPLTLERPKPLLKILNKTILERNLEELNGLVEEVIIIVGYKKEIVQGTFGSSFKNLKIKYVEQDRIVGTGAALLSIQGMVEGRFLVLHGDDLYKKSDMAELCKYSYSVLAQKVQNPSRFGVFKIDENYQLQDVVEKPKKKVSNLVNTGCYLVDEKIFEHQLPESPRAEYEATDYLLYLAKNYGVQVVPVQNYWFSFGYSWDFLRANFYIIHYDFGDETQTKDLPEGVSVRGPVRIGKNVKFGKNVQLVGPAVIGNDVRINNGCYILPYTVIENDVVVDDNCMIAETVLMDFSFLPKNTKCKSSIVTEKYTLSVN